MPAVLRAVVVGLLAIFAAHGLAYVLLRVLPDPAVVALGVFSAQEQALEAFKGQAQVRPYWSMLTGLFQGNLGVTIDGVAVTQEIIQGLTQSLPRLGFALILTVSCAVVAAITLRPQKETLYRIANFLTFLPAFVLPMLGFSLLLLISISLTSRVTNFENWLACILSIAVGPACLILAQTYQITTRNLESLHARRYLAAGASQQALRWRLLHNWIYEVTPTLEKVVSMLLTLMLFAEPIFSLPGIGTIVIRAVRRSDSELLLGMVLVFAVLINLSRITAAAVRAYYQGWR